MYRGAGRKFHLHYVNFNDETVHCDLTEEDRAEAICLGVVALKQIDRVCFLNIHVQYLISCAKVTKYTA